MADRNRAAVDVQSLHRNAQRIRAVQHLHRERFVEFPQADVVDAQARALQQFRHREYRADAHFVGLAAGHREAAEDAQRLQAALFGQRGAHHYRGGTAVGELAGVACGDHAAGRRRADAAHGFQCGVGADAFVGGDGDFAARQLPAGLVGDAHRHRHRHDLVVEFPGRLRGGGGELAAHAVFVLAFFRNVVAAGHLFGGLQHVPVQLRLVRHQPRVAEHGLVHHALHAGNAFHAASDEHIAFAGDHALRGGRDGLQAAGAEAIDGHSRHADRAAGAQCDLACDVHAGRAFWIGAAHQHVLDFGRVDAGARDGVLHAVRAERGAVGHVESALPAFRQSGTRGGDDDGVGHGGFLGRMRCGGDQVKVLPSAASAASSGAGSHAPA